MISHCAHHATSFEVNGLFSIKSAAVAVRMPSEEEMMVHTCSVSFDCDGDEDASPPHRTPEGCC